MLDLVFKVSYDHFYQYLIYISWQDTINKAKSLMEQKRQEEARIQQRDEEKIKITQEQLEQREQEDIKKNQLQQRLKAHNSAVGSLVNQLAGLDATKINKVKTTSTPLTPPTTSPAPIKNLQPANDRSSIEATSTIESMTQHGRSSEQRNFFAKLIAGEFGLAKTFWLFGIVPDFLMLPVVKFTEIVQRYNHEIPPLAAFILFIYAIYRTIVLIGTWRASSLYAGFWLWKVLSRAHVAFGLLGILGAISGEIKTLLLSDNYKPYVANEILSDSSSSYSTSMTSAKSSSSSDNSSYDYSSRSNDQSIPQPSTNVPIDRTGKFPIYFAADTPPTKNIPSESPLCYKFQVSNLEEQLKKLKKKYPNLYDYEISKNKDGSKNLVAKRRDEAGNIVNYFYSTNPGECNKYQERKQSISSNISTTNNTSGLDGDYVGNGANADLHIFIENGVAAIDLKGQGCIGSLEGAVQVMSMNSWRVVATDPTCVIDMRRDGPLSFYVNQGPGCTHYHGFHCEFNGHITKSR
jgi:hypothetical protein